MIKRLLQSFIALTVVLSANAADKQTLMNYYKSLDGLKKEALKNAVHQLIKEAKVYEYGSGKGATWDGFYDTDYEMMPDGQYRMVVDRYSNDIFYFGEQGSSVGGMNIEHSFPKSWWGGAKLQGYKDLFNLMPSQQSINASKGNLIMDAVGTATTDNGLTRIGTSTHVSGTSAWEPGDKWKGDFARAYMYMATAYQDYTWATKTDAVKCLEQNAYPTLQKWAYTLYMQWAWQDVADDIEVTRNDAVSAIQGNRNPFIDFPHLADYIWGDSTDVAFPLYETVTTRTDALQQPALQWSETVMAVDDIATFAAPTLTQATDGTITYSSSDATVASVDATTGAVTLTGDYGTAIITAAAARTSNYLAGRASYQVTVVDGSGTVYELVTASSQLKAGDQYVIAYTGVKPARAMNTTQNAKNRSACHATYDAAGKQLTANTSRLAVLTLGGEEGKWTLNDGTGYLTAAKNSLTTGTRGSNFTITFTGNEAKIASGQYYIQYYSTSAIFAAYAGTQKDISLFHKVASGGLTAPLFHFSAPTAKATLGEEFTAPTLTCTSDGAISYESSNTGVATVDASTGDVTILAAGTTTITATVEATSAFKGATASYALSVAEPETTDPSVGGTTRYELVLSTDELEAGQTYVVAYNTDGYVMGALDGKGNKATYRNGVTTEFSSDKKTITEDLTDYEFTLGGTTDAWTLYDTKAKGYLSWSGANDLKMTNESAATDNSYLSISSIAANGSAEISFNASQNSTVSKPRSLRYNKVTAGGRFGAYVTTGNQSPVQLYKKVTVPQTGTISTGALDTDGYRYGTFYTDRAYIMPEGVEGTAVTVDEAGKFVMSWQYQPGKVVPAETALLVRAEGEATTHTFYYSTATGEAPEANWLYGTLTDETPDNGDGRYYKLTYKNGQNLGFYWGAADGAAFKNKAGKAYLFVSSSTGLTKLQGFAFGDDAATGLHTVTTATAEPEIYTLQGVRVTKPGKGIYIVGGKKVVLK